jgi:class 3 adenylate cyclase
VTETLEAYGGPAPPDADLELLLAPLHAQLGLRVVETLPGRHATSLPTSRWLLDRPDRIAGGVVVGLTGWTMGGATNAFTPPDHRIAVIEHHAQLLRAFGPADGPLLCQARVTHDAGEFHVATAEVSDGHGHVVATAGFTSIVTPMDAGAPPPAERLLATILFSDIVGSTEQLGEVGDEAWRHRLATHHTMVRRQLDAFRGREITTTGDGFLALFEAPARAVQCAKAIRAGLRAEGMEVTVGLHTGECELSAGDVSGIAVHAAARIEAAAGPGQILVSQTVRDLTAGSGLVYEDAGVHSLKGLGGSWALSVVPE